MSKLLLMKERNLLKSRRDSPMAAATLWPQRSMKTGVSRAFGKLRISGRCMDAVRETDSTPTAQVTPARLQLIRADFVKRWTHLSCERCGVTGFSDLSPRVFGHPMV